MLSEFVIPQYSHKWKEIVAGNYIEVFLCGQSSLLKQAYCMITAVNHAVHSFIQTTFPCSESKSHSDCAFPHGLCVRFTMVSPH